MQAVETLGFKYPYWGRWGNTAMDRTLPLILAGQQWEWRQKW